MEARVNTMISNYVRTLKSDFASKVRDMDLGDPTTNELLGYMFDYNKLVLEPTDFNKRKRLKNSIPITNRCSACKANGLQCTRRRKDGSEFCGTHSKGVPHGMVRDTDSNVNQSHNVDIYGEEINGIIYYLDKYNNIYKMEDIMSEKSDPMIIGSYTNINDSYKLTFNP